MKFNFKSILALVVLIAVTAIPAKAQFYSYRSFIGGYNLLNASSVAYVTYTNQYGISTNVFNSYGYNAYVFGGIYPTNANSGLVMSNSIYGTLGAFGIQTNAGAIVDATIWPDNNSDTASALGLFVSVCG